MKQNANFLLVGQVVKRPDGVTGTLKMFRDGKWLIDFTSHEFLKWVSVEEVQEYELV